MKLCMLCKHLWFDGGFPGVGPETPHECMCLRCNLLREIEECAIMYRCELDYGSDIEDLRNVMMLAETCPHYEEDK